MKNHNRLEIYKDTIFKLQNILNTTKQRQMNIDTNSIEDKQYMNDIVVQNQNGDLEVSNDYKHLNLNELKKIYMRCMNGLRLNGEIDDCMQKKLSRRTLVKIHDHTPDILQRAGLDDLPIFITQDHVRRCLTAKSANNPHYHGLLKSDLVTAIDLIATPILVLDDEKGNGLICVLDAFDHDVPDSLPLMVSIKIDRNVAYQSYRVDSNFMASMYGKEKLMTKIIDKAFNDDRVLAIDTKKFKALCSVLSPNAQGSHKFQAFITKLISFKQGNGSNFKRVQPSERMYYLNNFESILMIQQTKNKVNKKLSGNANSKKKVKKKQTSTQSQAVAQQAPPTQQVAPVQPVSQPASQLTPQQQQNFYLGTQGVNLSQYSASVIQKSIPLAGTEEGTQALIAKAKANRTSSVTQSNNKQNNSTNHKR